MPICLQLYSLLQHICFATVPGSFGDRWAAAQPFRWCRALPLIQPVHGQMDRQPWHTPSSLEKREGRHSTADTPCWSPVSSTVSTDGFSTSFSFSFLSLPSFFFSSKIRGGTWQERTAEEFHSTVTSLAPELIYQRVSLQVQGLFATFLVTSAN